MASIWRTNWINLVPRPSTVAMIGAKYAIRTGFILHLHLAAKRTGMRQLRAFTVLCALYVLFGCSDWSVKSSYRKYFRPVHLRLLLLAFPHFSAKEPHDRTNATKTTTWKKLLLSSTNAPEILSYFVVGANTKPLGASAWNSNEKTNFSTRQTFPLLSYANSYFLFSNFAVRDFILFTLDFNT